MERRAERRQEWAAKAETRATAAYNHSHNLVKDIPLGQPILVGHHSEGAHRRTLDRSWNALGKSVAETRLAEHHAQAAVGIQHALDRSIFSDDENAIEALEERIRTNEAHRDQMKEVNRLYRKGDAAGLKALGVDLDTLKAKLAALGSWFGQAPHMPYEMTNLGARIRDDKKRLEVLKSANESHQAAAASKDGVTVECHGNGYVSFTFADKPERGILDALRNAGFRWNSARRCWSGLEANTPEDLRTTAQGGDDADSRC
jgi:hypothetical protein